MDIQLLNRYIINMSVVIGLNFLSDPEGPDSLISCIQITWSFVTLCVVVCRWIQVAVSCVSFNVKIDCEIFLT